MRGARVKRASLATPELHEIFSDAIGPQIVDVSDYTQKPFDIELIEPYRPLRVYLYNLVSGAGTSRPSEYKAVLRVPGQPVGRYGAFALDPDRDLLLAAYAGAEGVFVLWDANLHPRFKNGGNIQVTAKSVLSARETGASVQLRGLASGDRETVYLCQASRLWDTILRRLGVDP